MQLGALFGTGRCGTTWLGAIVASHPDVAYRFEPFHRDGRHAKEIEKARRAILSDQFSGADLELVYRVLLAADPAWEKPPFFWKRYSTRLPRGRSLLWPVARRIGTVGSAFEALFTPTDAPPLVFKEVNLEDMFERLAARTAARMVYLIRHPCAVVSSMVSGQRLGVMPAGRQSVLPERLHSHDPELAERLRERLPELNPYEKQALLWRIDVEKALAASHDAPNVLVIAFENLCTDPQAVTERMFEHLGLLPLPPQTIRFLRDSTVPSWWRRALHGRFVGSGYFTVFRDPEESRSKWRRLLPQCEQKRVVALVEDSPAFESARALGHWD